MSAETLMLQIFLINQLAVHVQHAFFNVSVVRCSPDTIAIISLHVGNLVVLYQASGAVRQFVLHVFLHVWMLIYDEM
jgi:hypothetical protein